MGFIDDVLLWYKYDVRLGYSLGYKYARHRSEVLADCQRQARDLGERFLQGLVATVGGKDVYSYVELAQSFEMGARGSRLEKGYILYQLLHPLRSLQDSADVSDIVLGEVRPV